MSLGRWRLFNGRKLTCISILVRGAGTSNVTTTFVADCLSLEYEMHVKLMSFSRILESNFLPKFLPMLSYEWVVGYNRGKYCGQSFMKYISHWASIYFDKFLLCTCHVQLCIVGRRKLVKGILGGH